MSKKPYPKFSSEAEEIAWLTAVGHYGDHRLGVNARKSQSFFRAK